MTAIRTSWLRSLASNSLEGLEKLLKTHDQMNAQPPIFLPLSLTLTFNDTPTCFPVTVSASIECLCDGIQAKGLLRDTKIHRRTPRSFVSSASKAPYTGKPEPLKKKTQWYSMYAKQKRGMRLKCVTSNH